MTCDVNHQNVMQRWRHVITPDGKHILKDRRGRLTKRDEPLIGGTHAAITRCEGGLPHSGKAACAVTQIAAAWIQKIPDPETWEAIRNAAKTAGTLMNRRN
jgi:hypothetical protein